MAILISGISGVRGLIDNGFDDDVVKKHINAFAHLMGKGPIILGADSRPSGPRFLKVVKETLSNLGLDTIDLGVVPTPTVQLIVKHMNAPGGIIVTASHNPIEWNALKFVGEEGLFLDASAHEKIQSLLKNPPTTQLSSQKGNARESKTAIEEHIQDVLNLTLVNKKAVAEKNYKVVVDAINGAGSDALPRMLEALGCEVIRLNCLGDGNFVHTPEPLPENLVQLGDAVREHHAHIGIATDPDADRLAVVDECGEPLVEEYTLVLASSLALRHAPESDTSPIITNLSTTMALDDLAARYGRKVLRTPVGEIHVAKKMREIPSLIGGEGNGGVILEACHLGRDSLVASSLILTLMAETGRSISDINNDLPRYIMVKHKISVGQKNPKDVLEQLALRYADQQPNLADGVKLTWEDSWVHFRASNTEPIIRVFAEGQNTKIAAELVEHYTREIERLLE
jgi:phosphomannomutase